MKHITVQTAKKAPVPVPVAQEAKDDINKGKSAEPTRTRSRKVKRRKGRKKTNIDKIRKKIDAYVRCKQYYEAEQLAVLLHTRYVCMYTYICVCMCMYVVCVCVCVCVCSCVFLRDLYIHLHDN